MARIGPQRHRKKKKTVAMSVRSAFASAEELCVCVCVCVCVCLCVCVCIYIFLQAVIRQQQTQIRDLRLAISFFSGRLSTVQSPFTDFSKSNDFFMATFLGQPVRPIRRILISKRRAFGTLSADLHIFTLGIYEARNVI